MKALAVCMLMVLAMTSAGRAAKTVYILDPICGDKTFSARLSVALQEDGLSVVPVQAESLVDILSAAAPASMLILPDANCYPAFAKGHLLEFLKRGGNLLAIGDAPFGKMLVRSGNSWMIRKDAIAAQADTDQGTAFLALSAADVPNWGRSSNNPAPGSRVSVETSGSGDIGPALRIELLGLVDWDMFVRQLSPGAFPAGRGAFSFWAKGDARTPQLAIELAEEDGSRWYASVNIGQNWERRTLSPEDFRFWNGGGRGGEGDRINFAKVKLISIGLAKSFCSATGGNHTLWLAGFRDAANPYADVDFKQPVIEGISPAYKTYRFSGAGYVRGQPSLDLPKLEFSGKVETACTHWRTRGLGIAGDHPYRWIPLARVYDEDERERGVCASIIVSRSERFPNSAWGFLGFNGESLPAAHVDQIARFAAGMAKRMTNGDFLLCAGADKFCFYPNEPVRLGARVAHSEGPSKASVKLRFTAPDGTDIFTHEQTIELAVPTQDLATVSLPSTDLPPGTYRVSAELRESGKTVDSIEYELNILSPRGKKEFVTAKDGDFYVGGKKERFIGANYWPLDFAALETYDFWRHWLDPAFYDPEAIERDLALMQSLDMNLVSIQYKGLNQANALVDFLARCERHGVKANIFIPGAHPFYLDLDSTIALIKAARLWENETVFAYDVAWEPHVGGEAARKNLDGDWRKWILDRYGSFENAEKDWAFANRDADGRITCPTDQQIVGDGEWRRMVAAYRRFLDDFISGKYRVVCERIRKVDPNHLIGARTGYGGTGAQWVDRDMPFDLCSGAKHLDFVSPEGYGLGGDWANYERAGFTTLYGRFVSGGKPVFWSEYGYNIWPDCDAAQLEEQRRYYANIYRMFAESGANAGAAWWWLGGFRCEEGSDYGIVSPDWTPRPGAVEAKGERERMAAQADSQTKGETVPIEIDRDRNPRGYSKLWEDNRDAYVRAKHAGKSPELKTKGTGTDSSDCPLIAVGNVPCNGTNPPKFLNSEFNYVMLKIGDTWRRIEGGKLVSVPKSKPTRLRIGLGNTGEAKWLAPRPGLAVGAVCLVSAPGSNLTIRQPIPLDVPFFGDVELPEIYLPGVKEPVNLVLNLEAEDRTPFGEKFRVTLSPE